MVTPALKKQAEVTGHSWDEGKCTLGGGIEVPCIYRFYGPKKSKAKFRNELSKYIIITKMNLFLLYLVVAFLHLDSKRNISRIEDHGFIYRGWVGELINGVIIKLRTAWAYKRVGLYTGGVLYGVLRYK